MNIVNKLTLRHIKTHKKRSVLTIMAIIVSVAMVTAVFTSAFSFANYFANVSKAIDGSWHSIVYTNNFAKDKHIFDSEDIEKYGVSIYYGKADVNGKNDVNDRQSFEMSISAVDKNFLDLRNVKISQGAMPKSENELLIHQKFLDKNNLKWKVGDTIALPVLYDDGVKDKTFVISGITNSNVAETDYTNAFVYATDDIKSKNTNDVYIQFAKMDKSIYDKTDAISKSITKPADLSAEFNSQYLIYSFCLKSDATLKTIIGFCAIILVIISVVSIFMIYDSFAVSYQERARYLGMLASVGASKKQKRSSIYFEGFIFGLIGIPLGILAGILGIGITFKAISQAFISTMAVEYDGALKLIVNWWSILGTVLASAITIFVSSYIPALKASKTTAIDAIKQVNTVKVKNSKRLRTSKLAGKLFGYEGVMAVKNYKRNGRRSRNIVFSLVISVVVFLSVANFSAMFNDVMHLEFTEMPDITLSTDITQADAIDKICAENQNIKQFYSVSEQYVDFDEKCLTKDGKEYTVPQAILLFVDDNTIDSYAKQIGVDSKLLHDKNNPSIIIHNSVKKKIGHVNKAIEPIKNFEGKNFDCTIDTVNLKLNVLAQTATDYKNDKFYQQNLPFPLFIVSKDLYSSIMPNDFSLIYNVYVTCDDSKLVEEQVEQSLNEAGFEAAIYNANAQMESMNNLLTIVDVFVYGFIVLITIISIMNIINTISNSMNERRREFAMIRSVGMTPNSFKKMIYYESFRYGLISLAFSIPISLLIDFGMYKYLGKSYDYGFNLHPLPYLVAIVAVFVIIGIALIYSIGKIKDDNIIETLKQDIN